MNVQDRLNAITGEKTEQEVSTSSTDKIFRVDKADGQFFYNEKRQLHSFNDQPSIILNKGSKFWHKNGVLHRDNGKPAMIGYEGDIHYYIRGKEVYKCDHCFNVHESVSPVSVRNIDGTSYTIFYCADCEMRVNSIINHPNWRT